MLLFLPLHAGARQGPKPGDGMADCALSVLMIARPLPQELRICWPRSSARTAETPDDASAIEYTLYVSQRCGSAVNKEGGRQLYRVLLVEAEREDPMNPVLQKPTQGSSRADAPERRYRNGWWHLERYQQSEHAPRLK